MNTGKADDDGRARAKRFHRSCRGIGDGIIHAPSSTKNREQKRDPEMHQTRKGKQWYFGSAT
jgi:hypothetical protein